LHHHLTATTTAAGGCRAAGDAALGTAATAAAADNHDINLGDARWDGPGARCEDGLLAPSLPCDRDRSAITGGWTGGRCGGVFWACEHGEPCNDGDSGTDRDTPTAGRRSMLARDLLRFGHGWNSKSLHDTGVLCSRRRKLGG
jgi:hypothetical protein